MCVGVCVFVCVCVCVHLCTCWSVYRFFFISVCAHMYACMQGYMYEGAYVHVYICVRLCICVYMNLCDEFVCVCVYVQMYDIRAFTHTCTQPTNFCRRVPRCLQKGSSSKIRSTSSISDLSRRSLAKMAPGMPGKLLESKSYRHKEHVVYLRSFETIYGARYSVAENYRRFGRVKRAL